jgi:hypothetical protein
MVTSIIAIVLIVFGVVFVLVGRVAERGYWSQRDPSGDPDEEATSVADIAWRAGRFAVGEYRAPLRIMAIGLLIVALGVGFALVSVLLAILR